MSSSSPAAANWPPTVFAEKIAARSLDKASRRDLLARPTGADPLGEPSQKEQAEPLIALVRLLARQAAVEILVAGEQAEAAEQAVSDEEQP